MEERLGLPPSVKAIRSPREDKATGIRGGPRAADHACGESESHVGYRGRAYVWASV